MQIKPSILFSREKRKKIITPVINVSNFEILSTVVGAVDSLERNCLISLSIQGTLPLDLQLVTSTEIIRRAVQAYALQVRVEASQADFHALIRLGVSSIQLHFSKTASLKDIQEFTMWASKEAGTHAIELGLFLDRRLALNSLIQLVEETGIDSLTINQTHYNLEDDQVSLKAVSQITSAVKIPVILQAEHVSPTILRRLHQTGISGFVLDSLISHAYTAGIRSALRNRAIYDPELFASKGQKAVEKTIHHYLPIL